MKKIMFMLATLCTISVFAETLQYTEIVDSDNLIWFQNLIEKDNGYFYDVIPFGDDYIVKVRFKNNRMKRGNDVR